MIFEVIEVDDIRSEVSHKKLLVIVIENRAVWVRRCLPFRVSAVSFMDEEGYDFGRESVLKGEYNDTGTVIVGDDQIVSSLINADMSFSQNLRNAVEIGIERKNNPIFLLAGGIEVPFMCKDVGRVDGRVK